MSRTKTNKTGNVLSRVFVAIIPGARNIFAEQYLQGLRDGRTEALSMAHHAIATESVEQMKKLKYMLDCDPIETEFPCEDYLTQEGEG